jgi:predicted nucleic acid-binding protein
MPSEKAACFVDTNLLIYGLDPKEPEKRTLVADLLTGMIKSRRLVLSVQSLNECYRVVTDRRRLMSRADARRYVESLSAFCVAPSGYQVTQQAWRIQDATNFGWWDCVLLGAASLASVTYFLSEDMQHEQRLFGMTILNPFRLDPRHQMF